MELKKEFVLRNVAGENILVPIGGTVNKFNGLICMNEIAAFIWENIEKAKDEEELVDFILEEYEVEREVAKRDLDEFLQTLKEAEII